MRYSFFLFFFFHDTATTEIYTLSLHDALPISLFQVLLRVGPLGRAGVVRDHHDRLAEVDREDRKSTRLNSSHVKISYAVFCLKKKKKRDTNISDMIQTNHHIESTIGICRTHYD